MKIIAIVFLLLNVFLVSCKDSVEVSTSTRIAGVKAKIDSIQDGEISDSVVVVKSDTETGFAQKFGNDIPKDCGPSEQLASLNDRSFFDAIPILHISESLIQQILTSKGNKKFICGIAKNNYMGKEPLLDCSIYTDSLKLSYYTNKDNVGFKGGNLTYLQMIGGDIALFKGHIKIGTTWEEFLKIVGMDIEYQESKYRCIDIGGGSERWFYFVNGILREITYMSTI